MPTAPPTRCYCGAKATNKGRCPKHPRKYKPRGGPWATPSANTRTLTRADRQHIRDTQLAREPHCRTCGSNQNLEADHIIEIADGGAPTDPNNLQTLCRDCHQQKTQATRRQRAAKQRQQRAAKQRANNEARWDGHPGRPRN